MADSRINLLSSASSSASDDFFVVDGTTNGTRKLNAFSPTFGGNATVTGTLTVNGTNVSSIPRLSLNSPVETYNFASIGTIQSADVSLEVTSTAATGVGLGLVVRRTNGGEFARFINGAVTTRLANMSCDAAGTYFSISSAVGMYLDSTKTMFTGGNVLIGGTTDIPGTGGLKVFGTTASTGTSSGALVVGNGTSGGLGVGGAINAGGIIKGAQNVYVSAGLPAGINTTAFQVDVENATERNIVAFGDSSRAGLITGAHDGSGRATWKFGRYTSSFAEYVRITGVAATDAILSVYGTTASTSTSSGALVVSGGVGVAGAIVSGGNIGIGNVNPVVAYTSTGSLLGSGDNPQVRLSATASTGWAFSTYGNTSSTGKWSAGLNAGSQGYIITNDLDLSGTAALQILPTTFAATFGGALLATGTLTANAASNAFRIANSQTPASASATGTAGTICWDTSYIYVCTATNTWKRVAISTW